MSVLFESYGAGENATKEAYGIHWFAQTFLNNTAHTITSVKLRLYRPGNAPLGNLNIVIRNTAAGLPIAGDLCSGSIVANTVLGWPPAVYEILLGAGALLTAGLTYAIVLSAPTCTDTTTVGWRENSAGGYAGGTGCWSNNSGVNWTAATYDFMFEDWGNPAAVTAWKDIASRFLLSGLTYKDIATRFLLSGTPAWKDIATRFFLAVQGYKDTATRFILSAQGYKDIATRYLIHGQGYVDVGTRFSLVDASAAPGKVLFNSALLLKPTSRLSQITIDQDKDWAVMGITNLKELGAAMAKGDILFFDGTRLVRLPPSSIGSILTTHDFGNDPDWTYPP